MRDLLIITPTRGRPDAALRLAEACRLTCTAQADLILAVDDDDTSYDRLDLGAAVVVRGPRQTCGQWTNQITAADGPDYRAVASLGDDHVPRTHGWDSLLLAAIDDMGGTGIAYPDDLGQRENLPTAPVVSSDIPAALGWFFCPPMIHYWCDNVLKDIGEGAGCLQYVPEAVVEHIHPGWGKTEMDVTYYEAWPAGDHDKAAYEDWRAGGMAADVEKVRALRAQNPGGRLCPSA